MVNLGVRWALPRGIIEVPVDLVISDATGAGAIHSVLCTEVANQK